MSDFTNDESSMVNCDEKHPFSKLPRETLVTINNALHQHLRSHNVYDTIREIIGEIVQKSNQEFNFSNDNKVLSALNEKDVIHQVIDSLDSPTDAPFESPLKLLPHHRYLVIRLKKARNLAEDLTHDFDELSSTLQIHLQLGTHRYCSRAFLAAAEHEFNATFLIDFQLQDTDSDISVGSMVPLSSLLQMNEPIHVLLLREDKFKQRSIISSQMVEWRSVLIHGRISLVLELYGIVDRLETPIGMLDVDIEVVPFSKQAEAVEATSLENSFVDIQLSKERKHSTRLIRQFRAFSTVWWNDFLKMNPQHYQRSIKMFACSEHGETRFVSTFLRPIMSGRLFDSALHAARFVRLIPLRSSIDIGGERSPIWTCMQTFLCMRAGDVEEHCLLLCSLLLGFGLRAFVCVGKNDSGVHMWVMTRESNTRVEFWESITGVRYIVDETSVNSELANLVPYTSIGCVFDHENFYANVQLDNRIENTKWHLESSSQWKHLAFDNIKTLPLCRSVSIIPNELQVVAEAVSIEHCLQQVIATYRLNHCNIDTKWDYELAHILSPALSAYESQIVTGISFANNLFQQSIKNIIPLGYAFKGFPVQFEHRNADKMLTHFIANEKALDILKCSSDDVHLSVRCKVIAYAESICAVWVMIAAKFKSNENT